MLDMIHSLLPKGTKYCYLRNFGSESIDFGTVVPGSIAESELVVQVVDTSGRCGSPKSGRCHSPFTQWSTFIASEFDRGAF